jgi:hypothetical protein
MANPKRPSAAVTAAGIIAIVGSAFSVFGALLGLVATLIAPLLSARSPTPAFAQTIAVATMIFFLAVAVFGIFTGVGLLRLRNWARISALVWAGISVPMSAFVLLAFAMVPMPPPPNTSANVMHLIRGFLLLFYGIPLGLGVWWLILFTRKAIAAQFTALIGEGGAIPVGIPSEPLLPAQRSLPLPITVLACFFLVSSLSIGFVFWTHVPAMLFGFAVRGPAGAGIYALWCLLFAASGIGVLKRTRWSYSLAIGLQIFGLLSGGVTLLSPKYGAIMQETISSMNVPSGAYPANVAEQIRAYSYIGLLVPIIILALLVYYRSRYLEAISDTRS